LDCREPLDVLGRLPKDGRSQLATYLQAAYEAVKEAVSADGQPTRTLSGYARAYSKGISELRLTEAIVFPAESRGLDLSEAVGPTHGTIYQLDWCQVGSTGEPSCVDAPDPTPTRVTAGQRTFWTPRILHPGLYEIFVCDFRQGRVVRGTSAFVLVAPNPNAASKMRKQYETFASLMSGWDPYEKSMLLRAYMQYLNLTTNG
jgi:hypothetical protein